MMRTFAAGALALLLSFAAAAQDYPNKPVRLVVPFPTGSISDALGRIVADRLGAALGQNVLVENKGGAGGNIGSETVARAAPDGYTLVLGAAGPHSINEHLYKQLGFDPHKDFAPIALLVIVPNILVVNNDLPARDVRGFIDYAKANPGRIAYGSIGNGSSQHLAGTQFESATGVKLTHVPYRGAPPAIADLLKGDIQAMFQLVPNIAGQVKAGQVRALAVTSATRSSTLPDVPTMKEAGVPDYETAGWFGLLAPAGTPQPILGKLAAETARIMKSPEIQAKMVELGCITVDSGPAHFDTFITDERAKWKEIVKASGAQLD